MFFYLDIKKTIMSLSICRIKPQWSCAIVYSMQYNFLCVMVFSDQGNTSLPKEAN